MTDEVSMTAQIAQVAPKGGGTYVRNPSANPAGAGRITHEFTPNGDEMSIFVGSTCCIWFRECIRCILHVYSWYYISCFGGEFQVQYNAFISWMYYLTFDSFSGMCDLIQSFFFAEKVSIFSHFKAQPKEIASNGRLQHSHECPAAKKRLIIAAMACNNLWLEPDRVLLFFNSSKTKCALPFRDSITVLGFASILPFFKHKAWKLHWLLKRSVWKAVMIGVSVQTSQCIMHYMQYVYV